MTTTIQFIPQWLRRRLQKPDSQKATVPGKKDRQILPTVPRPPRPTDQFDDDGAPLRFRVYWRM